MKLPRNAALVLASAALVCSAQAVADHNSKNGEGWANMPNDIHNTRLDTRASDDNEAFRDFVRYGAGAESVNRFDDGEKGGNEQMKQAGPPAQAAADQDRQRDHDKDQQKDRVQDRLREHQDQATAAGDGDMTRARQNVETRQSNRVRQSVGGGRGRGQSGTRQGGGRGGR